MKINTMAVISLLTWSIAGSASDGFLHDSKGNIVTDGFGECVSINKLKHAHGDQGEHTHCGAAPKKAEAPKPEPAPAPKSIVLQNVSLGAHALFDVNKSSLRPEGKAELDALANNLSKIKRVDKVSITGHTDSSGSEKYNQGLSERRAKSVSDYLAGAGVDASIIKSSGRGELEPVATNKTSAGRQQNRRVDIVIEGAK